MAKTKKKVRDVIKKLQENDGVFQGEKNYDYLLGIQYAIELLKPIVN